MSNIIADSQKLEYAKANGLNPIDVFIPQFESFVKNGDEINKLKTGDIFELARYNNGERALLIKKDGNAIQELHIDRETCFRLLPPVERFFVAQNKRGSCYQISSYISKLNDPLTKGHVLQSLRQEGNNLYIKFPTQYGTTNRLAGKFPDYDKYGRVRVNLTNGQFVPENDAAVRGVSLVQELEYMYGKHRKYDYANKYLDYAQQKGADMDKITKAVVDKIDDVVFLKNKDGSITSSQYLSEINKSQSGTKFSSVEDYYKEAGTVNEVFDTMNPGHFVNHVEYNGGKTDSTSLSRLRQIFGLDNAVKNFGTTASAKREAAIIPEKSLYSGHAYSVLGFDKAGDRVTYINPWNSALTYDMPLKDLAGHVNGVCLSRYK